MTTVQTIALLVYISAIFGLCTRIDFKGFSKDKKKQHLVLGATVGVFGLWLFKVGVTPGLDVHFLWLTALTLVLGFRWALLSGFISLLASTIAGYDSWSMFGVNGILGVSIPIGFSYLVYTLAFHKLPRHFLVYVFLCSFLTGALAIALKMLLLGGYYIVDGIYGSQLVVETYIMLIPLLLFSEAMLNGMTLTLLIIYRPSWIETFYDKIYFAKK